MASAWFGKHVGTAVSFALVACLVLVPLLVAPFGRYFAGTEAARGALSAARFVDAALERGERADVAADRVGARTGYRVLIVRADGLRLGDTAADGDALVAPLSPSLDRFVTEVGAAGTLSRTTDADEGSFALAGHVRGNGTRVLALRPLSRVAAGRGFASQLLLAFAASFTLLVLAFTLGLTHALRPAREMGEVARAIARGDFTHRVGSVRDDELGDIGRALAGVAEQMSQRTERLVTGEARLTGVLDAMVEGVFVTNSQGRIVLANAAIAQMSSIVALGRTPIEVLRSQELADAVAGARSAGGRHVEFELRVGETLRAIAATVAPLPGVGGVVAVLHDVTRLKEVDRIRRDFVANASHELKTPLTAIRGYTETLQQGAAEDPAMRARFLGVIHRHSVRLDRLIQDLVTLSRAESPDSRYELEAVDAASVVRDVVEGLVANAQARAVRISFSEEGNSRAWSNAAALDQISVNLVQNAIQYGPEGDEVRVAVGREGERVLVTVWNGGPAIPPEHLERLFERFYRVDAGRSREMGGTGLGLSIVKHLASRIGAEVTVESTGAGGTTFRVSLRAESAPDGSSVTTA